MSMAVFWDNCNQWLKPDKWSDLRIQLGHLYVAEYILWGYLILRCFIDVCSQRGFKNGEGKSMKSAALCTRDYRDLNEWNVGVMPRLNQQ